MADVLLALTAASLSTSPVQRKGSGLVRRLRTLIAQHFDDAGFGPAQAVQLAGVSVRGVHAALAREGSTFGTEQMEYRLQRARQRLIGAAPHLWVAAVASECGFRSLEHF